jgi:peptidoglycan/LPS O-acetylase OafA/YrhL
MGAPRLSARPYYRPELDVVRFLAFVLVFFCHTLPASPGPNGGAGLRGLAPLFYAFVNACSFGLSLFFALSAFLICELLLRERETTGSLRVSQFYVRRILRIWPLYYLGLAIGLAVAFLPGGAPGSAREIGWYVIFMGAWQTANHGGIDNPMFVLWSISVEEQFYLVVPWVVKYLNRKSLYGFCAMLILVANLRLYCFGVERANSFRIWADSLVQFECFAAGLLLCLLLHGRLPRLSTWQRVVLLAGSCCCWFFASYKLQVPFGVSNTTADSWHLISGYALGSLGAIMILIGFLGVSTTRLPGWAIYLGRISFGLYVFHELAAGLILNAFPYSGPYHIPLFLLKLIIAFALTILLASISYRFFETPFLRIKQRHAIIESRPV